MYTPDWINRKKPTGKFMDTHTEKSFKNLIESNQKSDCIYHALIDYAPRYIYIFRGVYIYIYLYTGINIYIYVYTRLEEQHQFMESFQNLIESNQKSDCIYHAPIDSEQQTDSVRLLFHINQCMVNTI